MAAKIMKGAEGRRATEKGLEKSWKSLLLGRKIQSLPNMSLYIKGWNIKRYIKFTIVIFLRDSSREKMKVSEEGIV